VEKTLEKISCFNSEVILGVKVGKIRFFSLDQHELNAIPKFHLFLLFKSGQGENEIDHHERNAYT